MLQIMSNKVHVCVCTATYVSTRTLLHKIWQAVWVWFEWVSTPTNV